MASVAVERLGQRRGEMQDMQVGGNGHPGLSFPLVVWLVFRRIARGAHHEPQLPRIPPISGEMNVAGGLNLV